MSKSDSGRIVIEIEPSLKRQLYSTLAMDGSTLKDWFIQCAESYLEEKLHAASQKDNEKSERRS